jgi:hypothetical protein
MTIFSSSDKVKVPFVISPVLAVGGQKRTFQTLTIYIIETFQFIYVAHDIHA